MLEFGGAVTAMRRLSLHLKGNGIASITVRGAGLYPVKADFFDGVYTVATGAPDLSFHTGAPLIPTFTVRRDDGSFLVTAEAPIEVSATSRRDAAAAAVSDYVRRLEPYVLQYPGQWVDWINI
jgi:lauroyl/myristoyl acyltransferase